MSKSIVSVPSNIIFLSEFINDLPENCIFDKGKTGAGGTSIALMNKENYVIAVPFLSLIENKTKGKKNILGIHSKVKDREIINYLNSNIHPKKIMVTYDSLCRIVKFIEPSEYRLLIDEYHLLFTSYSFRYEAVLCVLDYYIKFKSFCFMTATLLESDFILQELQHIPIVEYQWDTVKEVTVHSLKCVHSVVPTVSNIIEQHLSGKIEGNAHFFVNSVEFIAEIVKLHKLTEINTKAIWSSSNKIKVGLLNGSTLSSCKKINFYTSKCFEGVDLSDKEGKTYIVSDKSKSHTLVDISTSIQQICGRLRDTKFATDITHIFTTTRYDIELNYEQYKESTKTGIEKAYRYTNQLNNLDDDLRNQVVLTQDNYVSKRSNIFLFDDNLVKIDLYNYKITKHLYRLRINLTKEYQKVGYNVNFNIPEHLKSLVKERFAITNYFKETVLECKNNDSDYTSWAFKKYDFLQDAIKYLGYEKIEKMEYNTARVKLALIPYSHKSVNEKVKMLLHQRKEIFTGGFITNESLKQIFSEIYDKLKIDKTPKSCDVNEYYKVKTHKKYIKKEYKNGVVIL